MVIKNKDMVELTWNKRSSPVPMMSQALVLLQDPLKVTTIQLQPSLSLYCSLLGNDSVVENHINEILAY